MRIRIINEATNEVMAEGFENHIFADVWYDEWCETNLPENAKFEELPSVRYEKYTV